MTRDEPTLDRDGYPTEETLTRIQRWPADDVNGALDYARAAWHWPESARETLTPCERELVHAAETDRYVRFATGGWSGNESIIAALNGNLDIRMRCWCLHARGGLHIYRYDE